MGRVEPGPRRTASHIVSYHPLDAGEEGATAMICHGLYIVLWRRTRRRRPSKFAIIHGSEDTGSGHVLASTNELGRLLQSSDCHSIHGRRDAVVLVGADHGLVASAPHCQRFRGFQSLRQLSNILAPRLHSLEVKENPQMHKAVFPHPDVAPKEWVLDKVFFAQPELHRVHHGCIERIAKRHSLEGLRRRIYQLVGAWPGPGDLEPRAPDAAAGC
mmetsp:Transcript_23520/g.52058  ORF Transcript_23520/g.52058 Transcript_23520/m.52058 type:complete len:215 (+) Transcript_23520:546-1190(+)